MKQIGLDTMLHTAIHSPRPSQTARSGVVSLLLLLLLALALPAAAASRPHIVLIVLDDLDYYDVGAYGSPDIQTPTLDALAASGMRFEHHYSSGPVCSPTRVALLTGRHPSSFGVLRAIPDESSRGIPASVPTMPQILRDQGYRTIHVGKWHVGASRPEYQPPAKGFDRSFRFEGGGYLSPRLVIDEERVETLGNGTHLSALLTDISLQELQASLDADPERPVFLNLWHFAPHEPVEVPADFDNSQTRYCLDGGGDCDAERGRFAALVTDADRQIARLLQGLQELGIADDTLVIVASDNGGTGGNHQPQTLPGRPLRGTKGSVFDGGIRVPMIARWPGQIPEGVVSQALVTSVDFLPTLAEAAGASVASLALDGESFLPLLRGGATPSRNDPLIWENKPTNDGELDFSRISNTFAVRSGPWKLIYTPARGGPSAADQWLLFNLDDDPGERQDLLARKPVASIDGFGLLSLRFPPLAIYREGEVNPEDTYRVLASNLEASYWAWRQELASIPLRSEGPGPLAASGAPAPVSLDGSPRRLDSDERLDFNDGDFSLLTAMRPQVQSLADSTLAERPGSWRLGFEDARLALELAAQPPTAGGSAGSMPATRLYTPALEANRWYHVAFTVYGFRDAASVARLYLDGRVVAESGADGGLAAVQPGTTAAEPHLLLGNDASGASPFRGQVAPPRAYARSLYASEVMADYAAWVAEDRDGAVAKAQLAAAP